MTANTVNGSGNGARSGAQTLLLLVAPLNVPILRALEERPKRQVELRKETGSPAQTTLRAQLKRLAAIGAITKHRRERFPGVLEYDLAPAGRALLSVIAPLERWLERGPEGALSIGSNAARAATKALADGWSTAMLRALAAGPLSLTELDRLISSQSYPTLERRLGAMRLAGQIEARQESRRGRPYAVTGWLREAVAPLAAAIRWERAHLPDSTPPITRLDIETAFLLAVPLARLSTGSTGSCRVAAEIPNSAAPLLAGVVIDVEAGAITACSTRSQQPPDAWVQGSIGAWLGALSEQQVDRIELGGDSQFARAVLDGLREALPSSNSGAYLDVDCLIRDDESD